VGYWQVLTRAITPRFINELREEKMSYSYNGLVLGAIKNVRKSGDEGGVYFADVDMQIAEGFPFESSLFCARSNDFAPTGKWVYQQIIDGNFEGEIKQLAAGADPVTGEIPPPRAQPTQPTVTGVQTL
jgi:hypothetical protein